MAWNPRRSSPQRVYKKSYSLRCHLNGSAWKWTRVPTPSSKKAFLAHLTIVNGPKQAGAAGLERPEGSIREITVTVTRALLHTASSSSTFSPSGSRTGKGRAGARGTFEAARVTPTTLLLSSNAQGSCELRVEEDCSERRRLRRGEAGTGDRELQEERTWGPRLCRSRRSGQAGRAPGCEAHDRGTPSQAKISEGEQTAAEVSFQVCAWGGWRAWHGGGDGSIQHRGMTANSEHLPRARC